MSNYPPNQPPGGPQGQPPYGYNPPPPGQGYPPQPMPGGGYAMAPKSNGFGVAALVVGLIGFCIPLVGGLIALVLGILGIKRGNKTGTGKGLAIAGLILGLLSIALWGAIGAGGGVLWYKTKPNRELATTYIKALDGASAPVTAGDGSYTITDEDIAEFKSFPGKSGAYSSSTNLVAVIQNDEAIMSGIVTFGPGSPPLPYEMHQKYENGKWVVTSFNLGARNGMVPASRPASSGN